MEAIIKIIHLNGILKAAIVIKTLGIKKACEILEPKTSSYQRIEKKFG
ncbi:hypothetical protein KIS1582_0329 [Cytobacillus firmus]|uniref:Uncharacterized protein n=1 Tax=Cytobacillus firmus TaxID=1399 RepID=A0A800NGY5_CYTFI|nr:hypothetical protein KIS1582_0329 [Cytobacillus firmus]